MRLRGFVGRGLVPTRLPYPGGRFQKTLLCVTLVALLFTSVEADQRLWRTYGDDIPLSDLITPALSTVPGDPFQAPQWSEDSQHPYFNHFRGQAQSPALGSIVIPERPPKGLRRRDGRYPSSVIPPSAALVTATLNVANRQLLSTPGIMSHDDPKGAPSLVPHSSIVASGLHELAMWMNVHHIDVLFLQEVNLQASQEIRASRDVAPFRFFLAPSLPRAGQSEFSTSRTAGVAILLAPRLGRLCPTSFVMSDGRMVACRVLLTDGSPLVLVSAYMYSDPFDKKGSASDGIIPAPLGNTGTHALRLLNHVRGDLLPTRSLRQRAAAHHLINVSDFCRNAMKRGIRSSWVPIST